MVVNVVQKQGRTSLWMHHDASAYHDDISNSSHLQHPAISMHDSQAPSSDDLLPTAHMCDPAKWNIVLKYPAHRDDEPCLSVEPSKFCDFRSQVVRAKGKMMKIRASFSKPTPSSQPPLFLCIFRPEGTVLHDLWTFASTNIYKQPASRRERLDWS